MVPKTAADLDVNSTPVTYWDFHMPQLLCWSLDIVDYLRGIVRITKNYSSVRIQKRHSLLNNLMKIIRQFD